MYFVDKKENFSLLKNFSKDCCNYKGKCGYCPNSYFRALNCSFVSNKIFGEEEKDKTKNQTRSLQGQDSSCLKSWCGGCGLQDLSIKLRLELTKILTSFKLPVNTVSNCCKICCIVLEVCKCDSV